jgi:hypothetical protein
MATVTPKTCRAVFGITASTILSAYDPLLDSTKVHLHEAGRPRCNGDRPYAIEPEPVQGMRTNDRPYCRPPPAG